MVAKKRKHSSLDSKQGTCVSSAGRQNGHPFLHSKQENLCLMNRQAGGLGAGQLAHFQRCRPRTRRAAGGRHKTPLRCLWPRWPQTLRPWRHRPPLSAGSWGRLGGRRAGRRRKRAHHARSKKVSHRGGPRYSPTSTEGTCTTAEPAKNRPAQAVCAQHRPKSQKRCKEKTSKARRQTELL